VYIFFLGLLGSRDRTTRIFSSYSDPDQKSILKT